MKRYIPMAVLLVVAIGFLIWRSQPEQVVKRRCKAIIEMLDQVDAGAGVFDMNRLDGLLAERVEFRINMLEEESLTVDREQVLSAYRWMGDEVKRCSFSIAEFEKIEVEGNKARVVLSVDGVIETKEIRSLDGRHACEFLWILDEDGKWRLKALSWKDDAAS